MNQDDATCNSSRLSHVEDKSFSATSESDGTTSDLEGLGDHRAASHTAAISDRTDSNKPPGPLPENVKGVLESYYQSGMDGWGAKHKDDPMEATGLTETQVVVNQMSSAS